MYALNEEFELLEDWSADPLIPGYMTEGCFTVKRGTVYALGWRIINSKWGQRMHVLTEKNDLSFEIVTKKQYI